MVRWFFKHSTSQCIFAAVILAGLAVAAWLLSRELSLRREKQLLSAAQSSFEHGDFRNAVVTCRQLLQRNPNSPDACRLMIAINEQANSPQAIAWALKLADFSQNDPEVLTKLAALGLKFGEIALAKDALNRLPTPAKKSASTLSIQAIIAITAGQLEKAESLFERAARLEPSNLKWRLDLLKLRLQFRDPAHVDSARQELEVLSKDPGVKSDALRALLEDTRSQSKPLRALLLAEEFLGELLRMRILARLFLICIGLVLALFCNVGRTVTLVCIADAQGFAAMEKWHDPAGFSVSSISLLLLYFFARPLGRPAAPDTGNSTGRLEPLPMPLILGFSGWFLFFIVGSEIWYRHHETKLSGIRHLSIVWPSDVAGISKISIPDSARRILLYDDAQCASWLDRNGLRWTFYSLIWNSGRTSTQSARVHRPENCLQGSGAILHKEMQPTIVQVGGIPLAFRTYLFDWNETTLHVFYLIWEDGNRDLDPTALGQDWSGISRLQRIWLGQRNLGQQTLEVVLSGATSDEEARTTFQAELEKIVRIRS